MGRAVRGKGGAFSAGSRASRGNGCSVALAGGTACKLRFRSRPEHPLARPASAAKPRPSCHCIDWP